MADQAPEHKADPASAQYVVNLTPEQHETALKAAKDAQTPRPQMEMGGSGTAKVSFTDAAGTAVAVTSAEWSATGPLTVTADEADPASAKLVPTGVGPATVTAVGTTEFGSSQASAEVMVIDKIGAPVSGAIEITVAPPAPPAP
jgi:hypothetical protein